MGTRSRTRVTAVAVSAALVLGVAACGDDAADDGPDSDDAPLDEQVEDGFDDLRDDVGERLEDLGEDLQSDE